MNPAFQGDPVGMQALANNLRRIRDEISADAALLDRHVLDGIQFEGHGRDVIDGHLHDVARRAYQVVNELSNLVARIEGVANQA